VNCQAKWQQGGTGQKTSCHRFVDLLVKFNALTLISNWNDTAGQPISAHEHFVGRFFGVFYWYGTSYKGNPLGKCGLERAALQNTFNVCRSTNPVDWEYLGECLKFPKTGFGSEGTFHRPCVIYNQPTRK
jgi:hypothetical protein